MGKQITKIRRSSKRVLIAYRDTEEGHNDEIELKSDATPKEDFDSALSALNQEILEICHFPKNYAKDLQVTGLTIGDRKGIPIVTLVGKKTLPDANSPLNLATPARAYGVNEEDESSEDIVPDATQERIKSLLIAAEEYLNGARDGSQLGLDDGDRKDSIDLSDDE